MVILCCCRRVTIKYCRIICPRYDNCPVIRIYPRAPLAFPRRLNMKSQTKQVIFSRALRVYRNLYAILYSIIIICFFFIIIQYSLDFINNSIVHGIGKCTKPYIISNIHVIIFFAVIVYGLRTTCGCRT